MGWESIKYAKDRIPNGKHWALSSLSETDQVFVKEYRWGEEIELFPPDMTPNDTSHIVGIVLTGVLEVYEYDTIVQSAPIYCHRPIRVLEVGDIFNDFTFVDRKILGLGPQHYARNGEKWGVMAGISSMISLCPEQGCETPPGSSKPEKINIATPQDENPRFENTIQGLIRHKNPQYKIELAYVRVDIENVNNIFFLNMLQSAWKRVQTYRAAPNSYNISERTSFVSKCNTFYLSSNHPVGSGDHGDKYGGKLQNTKLFPIFVETIFDAINRIERHEPLFVEAPAIYFGATFSDLPTECLVAKRIRDDDREFYFPIDLANHVVCNYAKQHSNVEIDISTGFSQSGIRKPRTNSANKYHGQDSNGNPYKGSNKHYWMDTAEKIVKVWTDENQSSTFDISVICRENEARQSLLFLKFIRKMKTVR